MVQKSIKQLQKEGKLPDLEMPEFSVEHPEEKIYGDYATNAAMLIGKVGKKNPMEFADLIAESLGQLADEPLFEKIEVVKPGFINFFISKKYLQKQVEEILRQGEKFGELGIGEGQRVNVEFISANPTGPLTLGNGRGGFCGDVLSNILGKTGYKVAREYYVNDAGEQIRKLGHSILGDKEAVYKGDYISELQERLKEKDIAKLSKEAADLILKEKIMPAVGKMEIGFDEWFYESQLYKTGEVEDILSYLKSKKLTYEEEGALWFNSKKLGDDKDRVLVKADGEKTYFLSDIAYLKNKFERGFQKLIFFWGADHYGYINRMKAAAEALGYKKEQLDIIIMQLVSIMQSGEKLRMSKREGVYRTIEELIDNLGIDIVRFFFLMRSPTTHLVFNLDLAKEQSEKNPVYYIQYAHARICSILRKIESVKSKKINEEMLEHPSELRLIKELIRLLEIIEDTAKDYQVQRIPQYALDIATSFHQFYRDCQVISEKEGLNKNRLNLISATKIVLKNTLNLMGISAPEKM